MATVPNTTTDANGNIIINVSSSANDAITLATAGTYSDKNIIFNITARMQSDWNQDNETAPDYIKNKPVAETEDDAMKMLIDMRVIDPVTDEENNIFTDENGNILTV